MLSYHQCRKCMRKQHVTTRLYSQIKTHRNKSLEKTNVFFTHVRNQCVTSFTSIDEKLLQLLSNQLGSINWKASISKFKHCSINKCCRTKKAERSHDFEKAEKAVPEGGGRKESWRLCLSWIACSLADKSVMCAQPKLIAFDQQQ